MAGQLGRVLVGGKDCGAGFALGPRLVVTANHVVREYRDKPVVYVPAGGEAVGVERVQPDVDHDAAILWLVSDVGEFLPTSAAVRGAKWRVESPPPGGKRPAVARDGHHSPNDDSEGRRPTGRGGAAGGR